MNRTLTIVLSVVLAGCSNSYTEVQFPAMPAELKDCKVFRLTNEKGAMINVVRCPNSITTTNRGKPPTTVVIDNDEQAKK